MHFSFPLLIVALLVSYVGEAFAVCTPSVADGITCLGAVDDTCRPLGSTTMDGNRQNIIACLDDGTSSHTARWKGMSGGGSSVAPKIETAVALLNKRPGLAPQLVLIKGAGLSPFLTVPNFYYSPSGGVPSTTYSYRGLACDKSTGWYLLSAYESLNGDDGDLAYYTYNGNDAVVTNDFAQFPEVQLFAVCVKGLVSSN